jgi:hypothetical protein
MRFASKAMYFVHGLRYHSIASSDFIAEMSLKLL